MADLYLPVILGTVRKENYSHGVADFVVSRASTRPSIETRLFDPADLPFGNLLEREWEMKPQPPAVASFVAEMARADGFLIVTPEYNRGVPGALKNLLDAIYQQWGRKPFAFVGVSNGYLGGARAIEALRLFCAGVGAVPVPFDAMVRQVPETFQGNRPVKDEKEITSRVDKLWVELEWYARALKLARANPPK